LAVGSSSLNRQDAKNAKQSEETTNQAEISLASSFVKAVILQIFRVFRAFRGQKKDSDCRSIEKVNCFF
jgi:Tfp pilus assembly PilM family ATPase